MLDFLWNFLIREPMINSLIWLYGLLGQNYLLAILIFTALTRLILLPLTMQQQKSTAAMQEIQPEIKKLQAKYKDDQATLSQKTMELYSQHGVNPLMGCLPMVIQLPILFGLYQALSASLASSPLALITLAQHIYPNMPSWLPDATALIPLRSDFYWLDLSKPDHLYILPVLVVVTTWLQNKLLTPPNPDPQQASMNMSMQLMMPLMIGYFSLNFPSGLSIYWIVANVIGVAQYAAMGKAALKNIFGTPDGSFSWRGLLGLPAPEPVKAGGRRKK